MSKQIENGAIVKRLSKQLSLEVVLSGLALILSIGALFQAREVNRISLLSLPSIEVLTISSSPIKKDLPNDYVATVCRTELRIANIGGSGTSVIGVRAIGDFGRGGYLPKFGQGLIEFELSEVRWIKIMNFSVPIPNGPEVQ